MARRPRLFAALLAAGLWGAWSFAPAAEPSACRARPISGIFLRKNLEFAQQKGLDAWEREVRQNDRQTRHYMQFWEGHGNHVAAFMNMTSEMPRSLVPLLELGEEKVYETLYAWASADGDDSPSLKNADNFSPQARRMKAIYHLDHWPCKKTMELLIDICKKGDHHTTHAALNNLASITPLPADAHAKLLEELPSLISDSKFGRSHYLLFIINRHAGEKKEDLRSQFMKAAENPEWYKSYGPNALFSRGEMQGNEALVDEMNERFVEDLDLELKQ